MLRHKNQQSPLASLHLRSHRNKWSAGSQFLHHFGPRELPSNYQPHQMADGVNSGRMMCTIGRTTSNATMTLMNGLVHYLLGMMLIGSTSTEQLHLAQPTSPGPELTPA